jgi:hypothetical protein
MESSGYRTLAKTFDGAQDATDATKTVTAATAKALHKRALIQSHQQCCSVQEKKRHFHEIVGLL